MPRIAVANLAIRCLTGAPAHVPRLDVAYACETLKDGLNAPETSSAENRCLLFSHVGWMRPLKESSCPVFWFHQMAEK
jgi:hypothetical protein